MRSYASEDEAADEPPNDETRALALPVPVREVDLFKHSATPHILSFLSDNPDVSLSIRQRTEVTPVSERATREAVNALEAND